MDYFFGRPWRTGGWAGILFVILFIVGIVIEFSPEAPGVTNSDAEIRAYFAEYGDRASLTAYIYLLALLPLLVFTSALSGLLGQEEGADKTWSRLTLVGGVLYAAYSGASAAFWFALSQGSFVDTASDDTIRLLVQLVTTASPVLGIASAVIALSAAFVILRLRALPTWLGYFSVVVGVLAGLGPLQLFAENPKPRTARFGPATPRKCRPYGAVTSHKIGGR
jgi:hypothetical protein